MVLEQLDPNDPQPQRSWGRFGGDYKAFRTADKAWNERERTRRRKRKRERQAAWTRGVRYSEEQLEVRDAPTRRAGLRH